MSLPREEQTWLANNLELTSLTWLILLWFWGSKSLFQIFLGFQNQERVRTVTEAAGISMSEIASCSYEARAKGVKNGMFMGSALKLCPELGN